MSNESKDDLVVRIRKRLYGCGIFLCLIGNAVLRCVCGQYMYHRY